ncbi:LETM1 domain-containing protein 1 [Stomoxys calcitrans]|uniref:Letm1 RBD domain-containing protein n=1 Tax=Stomoxys calcitrans TaxID=35570 RepID=A0A1I8NVP2_STOCA|nr:LETM1 domain-containing protein 1 [Stomoxys calcitrans]
MTLVLRLTRLRATSALSQESLFQHTCLGNNALLRRRHYVTSSDPAPKKSTSSTPIPPNSSEYDTKKETPHLPNNDGFDAKSAKMKFTENVNKLQQATAPIKDAAKQAVINKAKLSPQQVRENVRGYMFTRFFDYVKNYDKVLEKNFPSAMKVYRVFFDGVKEFFADMKRFLKVARIVNSSSKGLKTLNRQELELYMQMPRDMIKVAPALILSSLPMVGYAIFPLVVMYPRTFLTAHFWTLQQRAEFREYYFLERLTYNRPVLRCLQAKLKSLKKHPKHEQFAQVLGQLGSGTHPSVEQILDIKDIFADTPFSLVSLPGKHIKLLNKMHGIPRGWFKRHSLYEHAFFIHYMDLAIGREGGVHNMPLESLRNACYIRGLNPVNMSNDDMITWLRGWIKVSNSIQLEHLTLFLHLPIFLAYNHPNNWQLLYGSKDKNKIQNPPPSE